jgi:hypothetical protein
MALISLISSLTVKSKITPQPGQTDIGFLMINCRSNPKVVLQDGQGIGIIKL